MRVATFYADCELPPAPKEKSKGFDWHQAIRSLERSAARSLGAETVLFTDAATAVQMPAIRVGDAKAEGIMLWLLDAQAEAIRLTPGSLLLASPDTLIAGRLDMLFGDWDVCLLTRERPTPIINSVIAVRPRPALSEFWSRIARDARKLSPASRAWGADVDAVVNAFHVKPREDRIRDVEGLRVKLLPIDGIFRSVGSEVRRMSEPLWDFKGSRKKRMPEYAELL